MRSVELPGQLRVAHVSDTHLGYEAYRAVAPSGENQRSVDVARALVEAGDGIAAWDPPLVVHSGDMAERPHIPIRLLLLIRKWLGDMASLRPDGSRRQVVIIAGNHDLPAQRREACFLQLFADLPGVHVVTDTPTTIEFPDAGTPGGPAAELAAVNVHTLPHDTLKDLAQDGGFDAVTPHPGRVNLLVAHGVAGGSTLYRRTMGREYAIPTEVLGRDWDYVALGHWHRQGPIGASGQKVNNSRVWYAGSTENMGFGDVLDNTSARGWLQVTVQPGQLPDITPATIYNRPMFRLPVLEGEGLAPEEIEQALLARVTEVASKGELARAVVGQVVTGVPRTVWSLVDLTRVRDAASEALHWEVTVKPVPVVDPEGDHAATPTGPRDLTATLDTVITETLAKEPEERRAAVKALASRLLGEHLAAVGDDPPADPDPAPEDSTPDVEATP